MTNLLLYRGTTEQEALKNLTQNVRELLSDAGLSSVFFEATGLDKEFSNNMILNFGGSFHDRIKAWPIIDKELSRFYNAAT